MKHRVAVIRQPPQYDEELVRDSVRRAMAALGLRWSELIRPGEHAVLKPNFIRQSHTERPNEWEQIITHGSLIAAVAREVAAAMEGRGTITIADAPQTDSDFEAICRRARLPELGAELAREFPGLKIEVLDLRREVWRTENGVIVERRKLPEDPRGYVLIDLGGQSWFSGKKGRFYGADYDSGFTQKHHSEGRHEYLLSRTAMDADLFVNLPKLKTHKKVGITVSLKNLVGINGDKNYLPHFCLGTPEEGGDEFPDSRLRNKLQSRLLRALKAGPLWTPMVKRIGAKIFGETTKVVRSGNWYGNDTAWRMVLDLNRAFFSKQRRYIAIVDGIIAGEGDGPMEADAKQCGLVLAGTNPFAVDLVAAQLMGFDWRKLPVIYNGISANEVEPVPELGEPFRFRPHFGWKGHIEAD
ncbi:MAG: DUF362 domain-containing protein [Verrucomicrobiae bacterium]|nr:DUF362 domain-containing protein [Verrucomicrobiae bacterium]